MIKLVQLARSSDGKLLAELYEEFDQQILSIKQLTKQIIKAQNAQSPNKLIIVTNNGHHINILQFEGVCFIACSDAIYPKQLAFSFLQELKEGFQEELKKQFGSGNVDYRSKIEVIDKPYYFLRFDRFIKRKKTEYQDVRSKDNSARMKEELSDIQNIQTQNIDIYIKAPTIGDQQGKTGGKQQNVAKKQQRQPVKFHKAFYTFTTVMIVIAFCGLLFVWKMGLFG